MNPEEWAYQKAKELIDSLPDDIRIIREAPCGCCNGPWLDQETDERLDYKWLANILIKIKESAK